MKEEEMMKLVDDVLYATPEMTRLVMWWVSENLKAEKSFDNIFTGDRINDKYGAWFFKKIDLGFLDWLNCWGNYMKHDEARDYKFKTADGRPNHITDFGRGYHQAISDVCRRMEMDFKTFDKRTKSGFSKDA